MVVGCGVSLGRCRRLLVGGLRSGRSRLLHRRAIPPWRLIVQGLGGSGLLRLLGVDGLGWHGRLRWGGGGSWGCVGSTWRYWLSSGCDWSRGDLTLLLAPEVSERRLGNQRRWVVGQAKVRGQASVGKRMLESMVLVQVLGLLWSPC